MGQDLGGGRRWEVKYFSDPEGGGGDIFHGTLANIFNKCYKKYCFHEKQLNIGDI